MSIALFQHNQSAYESAVSLMCESGKAAIIHPTGTGKSFIGFKLCEENPNKIVCWLSPSEYIFKTQLENLKKVSNGFLPENIKFFTYAKLMIMSEDEITQIYPDYIILDEFHRCGAAEWGKGVEKLLKTFLAAQILGLSATNIRYLDNQRDMADELFDGNIASQMSLGEAIVRDILLPPTYIICVYSYQKELEKYQRRISQIKNIGVRNANQKHLDALRRTLDKAEGLDAVFSKHIKERNGKFIVFCANVEHMQEMSKCAREWFALVDNHPHIYLVYSDNPETSREFKEFKQDKSEHLKLLFCIDMLNEGIHVEDISGVILFRPTVSPIIYKQQIGRALSASSDKKPIIFDIVNNFDNLYSIGTIQDEVQLAVAYYHSLGDNRLIINNKFEIFDETRDCRTLFEQLHHSLSAPWEQMYMAAKKYYDKHGNLEVPKAYKTEDQLSLGSWLGTQRRVRSGAVNGILTEKQIEKLNNIGMIWDNRLEFSWEQNFAVAKAYFEENGHLDVSAKYITPKGFALGQWITNLRQLRAGNMRTGVLTEERIARLDAIGMVWSKLSYIWEKNYLAASEFYLEYGHLDIPVSYKTKDGISLGVWIRALRGSYKGNRKCAVLTDDQIGRLNNIGMIWDTKFEYEWNKKYEEAKKHFEKYGNLDVSGCFKTKNDISLRNWLYNQRVECKNGKLSNNRIAKLQEIGEQAIM